jgi:hypothetical protein
VQVPDAQYAVIQDDHEGEEHDFSDVISTYLRAQRDPSENTAIHRQGGNREIVVDGGSGGDVEAQEEVPNVNEERFADVDEPGDESLAGAGNMEEQVTNGNAAEVATTEEQVNDTWTEAANTEEQVSNDTLAEVANTEEQLPNYNVAEQQVSCDNIEEDSPVNADPNASDNAQAVTREQTTNFFNDETLPPRRPTPNISKEAWNDIWHILSDREVVKKGGVFHLPSDNENGNVLMFAPPPLVPFRRAGQDTDQV